MISRDSKKDTASTVVRQLPQHLIPWDNDAICQLLRCCYGICGVTSEKVECHHVERINSHPVCPGREVRKAQILDVRRHG